MQPTRFAVTAPALLAAISCLAGFPALAQDAPEFDYPVTISGAAAAQRSLPLPRRQVVVSPQEVPVDRAGVLDFTPDDDALGISGWTGGLPAEARVRMWFDGQGQPVDCNVLTTSTGWAEAPEGWDREAFVAGICSEFMAKASFTYAEWFDLPVERAFIEREVAISRWLTPEEPVHLVSRAAGEPVELSVDWRTRSCTIDWLRVLDQSHRDAVCAAFLTSDEAARIASGNSTATRLIAYIPGRLGDGGAVSVSMGRVQAAGYGTRWPDLEVNEDLVLQPEDGSFSADLGLEDIPLGRGWTIDARIRMLLGIAPDGSVATCRPLSSNTFAAIDNATCAALVERGHYQHSQEVDWTGLRYMVQTVRWQGEG